MSFRSKSALRDRRRASIARGSDGSIFLPRGARQSLLACSSPCGFLTGAFVQGLQACDSQSKLLRACGSGHSAFPVPCTYRRGESWRRISGISIDRRPGRRFSIVHGSAISAMHGVVPQFSCRPPIPTPPVHGLNRANNGLAARMNVDLFDYNFLASDCPLKPG